MACRKIDINEASIEELDKLSGIGHHKAESIVKHRNCIGGFTCIDDLLQVQGIGKSIIEQNKDLLNCSAISSATRRKLRNLRGRENRKTDDELKAVSTHSEASTSNDSSTSTRRGASRASKRSQCSEKAESSDNQGRRSAQSDSVKNDEIMAPRYVEPLYQVNEDFDMQDDSNDSTIDSDRVGLLVDDKDFNSIEEQDEEEDPDDFDDREFPFSSHNHSAILSRGFARHWMKRKSGRDDSSLAPDKRICRSGEFSNDGFYIKPPKVQTLSVTAAQRRRIPSKDNPPPEFAQWLSTFQSWSNAERVMAIDELIKSCEPTQVRHMMQVIEPQFQRDFISLLPKELALYVLSFLDPKDLLKAAQTCRYWRILAEDNLLWREKCREETIDKVLVYGKRGLRNRQGSPRIPWKCLYMRQHKIEQNWRSGEIRPPKVLKGHDDHVITCLEYGGQRIVSGSDDNTLKVWSAITGKCLRTLVGHTGGVWSSQMSGHIVISGSTDRTLKVWNAETGQCTHTLYGHTSTVRCMCLNGNQVVSGSRDATLRVWDIGTGQCLHVLVGHVAAVRCVQYDGRRVVSGAYDYMVKVWDPETETCLHTLQGHTNRVYSLQFDGTHVVSGSLDTSIRVWEVETGNCLHTLIGHQSLTSGLELKDNILVSGNADSTVKVWDITTGQCLQTLQGPNKHQSAVTCLQFNKKFVITSSDDGTVKIWDLKTGDFLRNIVALESGGSGGVVWRLRCSNTKLVCAVGSRNGTEETKLLVLDFDVEDKKPVI